jgi:hypothetical protein
MHSLDDQRLSLTLDLVDKAVLGTEHVRHLQQAGDAVALETFGVSNAGGELARTLPQRDKEAHGLKFVGLLLGG